MENKQTNILIIGSLPSTAGVGGVTVHIQRFLDYLKKEGIKYSFFDYKSEKLFSVINRIKNSSFVHVHVSNPYYRFFLTLLCEFFHKALIITYHGKYVKDNLNHWKLIKFTIRNATVPIVLNKESYETCHALNSKTCLIPAFIPPQIEEKLDEDIVSILDEIKQRKLISVVTYGFDVSYDAMGREIYGIDFLVSFFKERKQYALIVSDPTGNYQRKYVEKFDNIYFISHPHSMFELMKATDAFVRNTSTDGDSLSVKEALYLHKKVICTDAVDRPKGVKLFHYSDSDSLESCLTNEVNNHMSTIESGEHELLGLYQSIQKKNND